MKLPTKFIFALCLFFVATPPVSAAGFSVAESSANVRSKSGELNTDYRVQILRNYFESHNSPLSEHSETFIAEADKYDLDWRLVPAISGVESTFGKKIPHNSYNAYGWAGGEYRFESWENSVHIVSSALREKYINNNAVTINQIGARYAPPSTTWSSNVRFFMNKIDSSPLAFTI